jgi:hypothetical protein
MYISLDDIVMATDSYTLLPLGEESAPLRDLLYAHQLSVAAVLVPLDAETAEPTEPEISEITETTEADTTLAELATVVQQTTQAAA